MANRIAKKTGGRGGVELVLAAAFVFLLQSVIGAWAIGLAEASPRLDIFGNPLCITSSDGAAPGHTAPAHAAACLVGCVMAVHEANGAIVANVKNFILAPTSFSAVK